MKNCWQTVYTGLETRLFHFDRVGSQRKRGEGIVAHLVRGHTPRRICSHVLRDSRLVRHRNVSQNEQLSPHKSTHCLCPLVSYSPSYCCVKRSKVLVMNHITGRQCKAPTPG